MNLRQLKGNGAHILRRLLKTAPAILLLVLSACGGESAATPTAQPAVQSDAVMTGVAVETGGMALPAAGATPTQLPSPTPTERPALQVGAVLTTTDAVVLYAEPNQAAPRFAEYTADSRFTVIEPDSDHPAYPVEVDGQPWYRVRAEDGLVGWMVEP